MRVLTAFLKPGWLLLAVVVAAFAAACFTILAPWQLGKNTDTEHRNNLIRAAADTPPAPLADLAPEGRPFNRDVEWREATMRGQYLPDKQALLRLRSVEERPAVEVLVPFRITSSDPAVSGRVVLVDRGYVRPSQTGGVDVADAPRGEVELTGRLRRSEGTGEGKGARVDNGALTVYTIDTTELGRATGLKMTDFYVQLSRDEPGSLSIAELPQLESGPYLSYGLQWLAFGVMAPLMVCYFIYAEVRNRRAERRAAEALAASGDSGGDGAPDAEAHAEPTADPPAPAATNSLRTAPLRSAKQERQQMRRKLHSVGTFSGNDVRGDDDTEIGNGGRLTDDVSDNVKRKLAERYGK